MTSELYRPSKHISLSYQENGELVVHSARTGAIGVIDAENADTVRELLKPGHITETSDEITEMLAEAQILVPVGEDEAREVHNRFVQRYTDRTLSLIVLPTEQCNFRCVYCYEQFLRGEMSEETQEALFRFAKSRIENIDSLSVSWFGGEPLVAPIVVLNLSRRLRELAEAHGVLWSAGATTNALLLTPELAPQLIAEGISKYQITLDGVAEEHDKRRVMEDGSPTYATIMDNLRWLRSSDLKFRIILRHNFDPDGLPRLGEYLDEMAATFGGDDRFVFDFKAIGRWGGANDRELVVCDGRGAANAALDAKSLALSKGLTDAHTKNLLQPEGAICYAADPNNFVVGSDGRLYKCTVELDYHDRNIVGRINNDGTLDLDWKKFSLWTETNGMSGEKKCTSCWFSPACHGATCPKDWLDSGDCECPPEKQTIGRTLTFINLADVTFGPPETLEVDQFCGR